MNNILLLSSAYFKMFITKLFRNTKRKMAMNVVITILIISSLSFSFGFGYMSYMSVDAAIKSGDPTLALTSFSTTALIFTFVIIISECSNINKNRDDQLLLSLPIKKSEIIISKILYYLVFDFVLMMLLIFPSYVVYYVVVNKAGYTIPFSFLIRGFSLIVFITLFSTGIAGIIAFLLEQTTKKLKYGKVFQSIFSMIFVIMFAIFYIFFMVFSQNEEYAVKIKDVFIIKQLSEFIRFGDFVYWLLFICISVIPFLLSIVFKSITLGKTKSNYHSNNTNLSFKQHSVFKSLFNKELGRFFQTPIYVSNTLLGPILTLAISIAIMISGKGNFINLIEIIIQGGYEGDIPSGIMPTINNNFDAFLCFGIILMTVSTPITSSSISLEGKELWILKAHPIDYKDVFFAKIGVNIVTFFIPLVFSSLFISIACGNLLYVLLLLIIGILALFLSSSVGLLSNLLFPKLEWTSEIEPVKQGISVLVSMGINVVLLAIPMVFYMLFYFNSNIVFLCLMALIYLGIDIIIFFLLKTLGKKLYYNL